MPTLSERFAADGRAGVRAVLGPTNTGKTHLALERMLLHRTGMIGLPLRLLAREVYERLVARAGEGAVALITGEEKLRPPQARYFVCTVEAMPVDKPVHFLAVDEVQLAAHRTRGHVFTDRILRARGVDETLFLGSDTLAPVLQDLVPTVQIHSQPRLSKLRHAGYHKLRRVPPRSAVVAFSAAEVYAHAERLRSRHGGCAVVLGALSPRTRNAQVDLYQSGAVDHLVATDAIGMGLNMDVRHVAFAAVRKFDGRAPRALAADELAQIAGRAGRYTQDGTFGTTGDCPELDPQVVQAIEQHTFPPIRQVWWRNHELDFSDADALLESLERQPPRRVLRRMADAEDHRALAALLSLESLQPRLGGPADLRLLWDVAQIPDYRKTLTGHHAELLGAVFAHLHEGGELPPAFVEDQLARLDRTEGDIDVLMTRIAYVRTWTFVSFRADWLADPAAWQERTRAIEDRLSDALHEQLTARFVDHRVTVGGRAQTPGARVTPEGGVVVADIVRGQIEGLELVSNHAAASSPSDHAIQHAATQAIAERVRALAQDPDEAFEQDLEGALTWRGAPIGTWQDGDSLLTPRIRLRELPLLDDLARAVVHDRLRRFTEARISSLLGSLRRRPGRQLPPAGLDVLLAVEQGLGTAEVRDLEGALHALSPGDRERLARLDLRIGRRVLYLAGSLKPAARALRWTLWKVFHGAAPALPPEGATSVIAKGSDRAYLSLGFPVAGGVAVRADVLERVYALARKVGRDGPFGLPPQVPSWLGCDRDTAGRVLDGLGFQRVATEVEHRFVPPPRRRPPPRRPR